MNPITILIVDDHPMMREALRTAIETEPDLQVVAEAGNGQQAIELALALRPTVIVMDLYLPLKDGLAASAEIMAQHPDARILAITSSTEDEKVVAAMQAGVIGYLLKDSPRDEFLRGLRQVAAGQTFLPPEVTAKLARGLRHTRPEASPAAALLTRREQEILAKLGEGLDNQEIARRLSLSESTVRVHLQNIQHKLGLENRSQAVVYALRHPLPPVEQK
jgi:DNA-binding NarL/FixJ family response regulator